MKPMLPKKILTFALCLLLFLSGASFALAQTTPASADSTTLTLEQPFPGLPNPITINGASLGIYINYVFVFACALIVALSIVMVIKGGVEWIIGGAAGKVDKAKDTIFKSLIGLVIALTAVVVLRAINPALVTFKPLDIQTVQVAAGTGSCATKCPDNTTCIAGECKSGTPNLGKCCNDSECASGHCQGALCDDPYNMEKGDCLLSPGQGLPNDDCQNTTQCKGFCNANTLKCQDDLPVGANCGGMSRGELLNDGACASGDCSSYDHLCECKTGTNFGCPAGTTCKSGMLAGAYYQTRSNYCE